MLMETKRFPFLIAAFLSLSIASCGGNDRARETEAVVLDGMVSPFELLISSKDLPPGWDSSSPYTFPDNMCYRCAAIDFDAHTNGQSRTLQEVYVFASIDEAVRMFNSEVEPRMTGYVPEGWDFTSEIADQSLVACNHYDGNDVPSCKWSGLYGNYIVQFFTWIIPGKMSVHQFENTIETIDERMLVVVR
jgi:hypothetical protein